MGTWFYLINKTKKQHVFLGRGMPMFAPPLRCAMRQLGWLLTDDLTILSDDCGWDRVLHDVIKDDFTAWFYKQETDTLEQGEESDTEEE